MQTTEPNKNLIDLAEKIIDQHDKILEMNGMLLKYIAKPQVHGTLATCGTIDLESLRSNKSEK